LQKLGVVNQESFQRSDPDILVGNTQPRGIRALLASWVWNHDPEKYAIENYDKAVAFLLENFPFNNTNIPRGHVYKPWTLDELLDIKEAGGEIGLDGLWE
jgi:hypothetical protein